MTNELFEKNLNYLIQTNPYHPSIAFLQEKGNSLINAILLKNAINEPIIKVTSEKEEAIFEETEQKSKFTKSEAKQLRDLHTKRIVTQKKFLTVSTNEERAAISDEIREIEKEISNIYHHTPAIAELSEKSYPEDKFELQKTLNSIRARLSQARKEVNEIKQLKSDNPRMSKLDYYISRVQALEKEKEYVEKLITA